jgi:dihydrofolate synthase / folylpolyglutamate synthase
MEAHPTFFEAVTVMALQYFVEQRCELVIWETGLGGRLDATNIVTPLASVITNIDYDHQQWLGNTLDEIAVEKAGIIKPGIPVITAAEPGRGREVITETARRLHAPLTVVTRGDIMTGLAGTVSLPLAGDHQRLNAAVTAATVRVLAPQLPVSNSTIRDGLSRVRWPGRMQPVKTDTGQIIVLDGAHNVGSAAALRQALAREFPGRRPALVLGILADKDWETVAGTLAPLAKRILVVPVNSRRTLAPERLAAASKRAHASAEVATYPSLATALADAKGEPFVVVTGSLYLVGEAMELLQLSAAPEKDERGLNEWSGLPGVTP